jgi:hypothetical protein
MCFLRWVGMTSEGRSLIAGILMFVVAGIAAYLGRDINAAVAILFGVGGAFIAMPGVSELSWGNAKITVANNSKLAEDLSRQLIEINERIDKLANDVETVGGETTETSTEEFKNDGRALKRKLEDTLTFATANNAPAVFARIPSGSKSQKKD